MSPSDKSKTMGPVGRGEIAKVRLELSDNHKFRSRRGFPLVLSEIPSITTVTVELAEVWACLFVVYSDGRVEELSFPERDDANQLGHVRGCPRPSAVVQWAKRHNCVVESKALELIVGRWLIRVVDSTGSLYG